MKNSTTNIPENITLGGELSRKLIHYCSAAIPIGYWFLDKTLVLSILIPLLAAMLIVEILKYNSDAVYKIYVKLFRFMLREHEYDTRRIRINGASWVIIADIICVIVFPKHIAIIGMLLLSLADSTSAIIGRVYGKSHYAPNRSYAGSIAFFIVGIIIVILTPKYFGTTLEYAIGFIAVLGTTVLDAFNLPADDNLTIPVTASILLYVLYIIFYPGNLALTLF